MGAVSGVDVAVAELGALVDRARHLEAYARLQSLPPVEQWTDPAAMHEARRLIGRLGDDRRSTAIVLRAFLRDRREPHARYGLLLQILHARGPVFAFRFCQRERLGLDRALRV